MQQLWSAIKWRAIKQGSPVVDTVQLRSVIKILSKLGIKEFTKLYTGHLRKHIASIILHGERWMLSPFWTGMINDVSFCHFYPKLYCSSSQCQEGTERNERGFPSQEHTQAFLPSHVCISLHSKGPHETCNQGSKGGSSSSWADPLNPSAQPFPWLPSEPNQPCRASPAASSILNLSLFPVPSFNKVLSR